MRLILVNIPRLEPRAPSAGDGATVSTRRTDGHCWDVPGRTVCTGVYIPGYTYQGVQGCTYPGIPPYIP